MVAVVVRIVCIAHFTILPMGDAHTFTIVSGVSAIHCHDGADVAITPQLQAHLSWQHPGASAHGGGIPAAVDSRGH